MTVALRATVLGPLRRLRGDLVAVSAGPSDARVTVVGTDELARMAEDINGMLDRLTTSAVEHDRLQDVVREQRDLAATALETMSEGLVAFDVQGFCIVCNPAAARLLGTVEARARGRHMTELLPGVAAPVGDRSDGPQILELNGRTLAVTRDRSGPPNATRHSVITLRDVTEVLDVERMRRDVISTVSHELRTPLTAIQATVEMLEGAESGPRNEVQSNLVSLLTRNVARLRRILDDLLTLSALEGASVRLDRDRLDIGVLANRVVEDLRPTAIAAGVAISCTAQGEVVAWADEARIRQVLENLVQNAIKFSTPDSEGVEVSVSGQISEVRIAVLDHGAGIPASELIRVFERFYRSTEHAGHRPRPPNREDDRGAPRWPDLATERWTLRHDRLRHPPDHPPDQQRCRRDCVVQPDRLIGPHNYEARGYNAPHVSRPARSQGLAYEGGSLWLRLPTTGHAHSRASALWTSHGSWPGLNAPGSWPTWART